jgi:hypothetical protein
VIETKKIDAVLKSKGGSNEPVSSMEFPRFEVPPFVLPPALQAFAQNQVMQGKETLKTLSTAVQEAYSTGVRGLNECGQKIVVAGHQDADALYDCCRELTSARSVPEVMDIWARRAPGHVNSMLTRTGELWALYWKVAADTAKPIATTVSYARARSIQA